jgi:queuine tRNA-ribosyltransferase
LSIAQAAAQCVPGRFELCTTPSANKAGTNARAGVLHTAHGPLETPVFMPVGTQGTVKGLTPADLASVDATCILANTYHLWLRPGPELVHAAGGLHRFMGWGGPILTDSGGFQVFSLAHLVEMDDGGAAFVSHVDGQPRTLTPELAMQVQALLGSDIAMQLDVCSPYPLRREALRDALERTNRWAERCLAAPRATGQLVFGIVQGGMDPDLRTESAERLAKLPFDGYGIGGLSVGEPRSETWPALEAACASLPVNHPRYLMGVGAPRDLIEAIARGVDMFDCVLPTRLGRHGAALTPSGQVDLRKVAFARRDEPLDPECDCLACTRFSLAYLHHLVRAEEDLGRSLISLHNIRFLTRLVEGARAAILEGRFAELFQAHLEVGG